MDPVLALPQELIDYVVEDLVALGCAKILLQCLLVSKGWYHQIAYPALKLWHGSSSIEGSARPHADEIQLFIAHAIGRPRKVYSWVSKENNLFDESEHTPILVGDYMLHYVGEHAKLFQLSTRRTFDDRINTYHVLRYITLSSAAIGVYDYGKSTFSWAKLRKLQDSIRPRHDRIVEPPASWPYNVVLVGSGKIFVLVTHVYPHPSGQAGFHLDIWSLSSRHSKVYIEHDASWEVPLNALISEGKIYIFSAGMDRSLTVHWASLSDHSSGHIRFQSPKWHRRRTYRIIVAATGLTGEFHVRTSRKHSLLVQVDAKTFHPLERVDAVWKDLFVARRPDPTRGPKAGVLVFSDRRTRQEISRIPTKRRSKALYINDSVLIDYHGRRGRFTMYSFDPVLSGKLEESSGPHAIKSGGKEVVESMDTT